MEPVHVYVFDTLSDWEIGYLTAGINNPVFQREPGRFSVKTVGESRDPITTAGGLRIQPDLALDEVDPKKSAMLVLPGGASWDEGKNTEAVALARRFAVAGVPIAAICGATAGLARGGLLDDVPHTSNASEYLAATGYKGGNQYTSALAVTAENMITAPAMGSLEFAKEAFKMLDLYTPEVLEAWYQLYKTGDASHFGALMQAVDPAT